MRECEKMFEFKLVVFDWYWVFGLKCGFNCDNYKVKVWRIMWTVVLKDNCVVLVDFNWEWDKLD